MQVETVEQYGSNKSSRVDDNLRVVGFWWESIEVI